MDDIPATTLLKQRLCDMYIRNRDTLHNVVRANWAFCSVDAGGEKLARRFSNSFGIPLVVAHKQRDYSKHNTVECVNILSSEPVEGKVLWIVDDMVDTAGSIQSLIRALEPLKPKEINMMVVHPVFSPPAPERLKEFIACGWLKHIIVTDTICCSGMDVPNLEVVPSAELSARAVRTIMTHGSMAKLLREFNAELYLRSPGLFSQP
jgi:ribose-phosphate pyrophosphokinase